MKFGLVGINMGPCSTPGAGRAWHRQQKLRALNPYGLVSTLFCQSPRFPSPRGEPWQWVVWFRSGP